MTKPLSMDQAFVKRLTEIVLDNLPDENFNVDQLAKAVGMSHSTLHRRLRAIKNQDVTHFIREVRLQRAMELLSRNEGNASEIAFKVGFGSPAYFTKCFHEYYGFPPGDVRKKSKQEEGDSIFQDPDDNEGSGQILKGLNNTLVRPKKTRSNVILQLSAFAEAWAGLSDAWFTVSAWGWYQPYYEGIMNAKKFSDKALELDPDCAEAHLVKGAYLIWPERKWEEGRKELRMAIQLDPNSGYAHQAYAQLIMITGPIEEARLHMNRVIELEPFFWVMHNLNAWIYYFEEKHEKAIEACKIARELKSDYILTNWLFFLNYSKLGEGEKAMEELQAIARSNPRSAVYADEIMDAYRKSGIDGLFNWLTDININRPVPIIGMSGQPFFTAWWYAILGKREESLYWLERNMGSANRNYTFFNLMATNPDFDFLWSDPRFLAIIEEIGLTPYNIRAAK